MEQFLHVTVTEGEAMGEPNRVLNDRHPETVAIGFRISDGGSAYPDPVKATQPLGNFCARTLRALQEKLSSAWQRVRYIDLPQHLLDANLRRDQ
ncbi:hypothetical protein M1R55_24210 (plasmid) [Deinococcus sp. QL22]|nr:hypothetical protein M1R55_24210 [Deinococcus sp. QL22]